MKEVLPNKQPARSCQFSKNQRKVRIECGGGGGEEEGNTGTCTVDRKSLRTIGSKMRQKTKSEHRAHGKLILYLTATKPLAVCPRSNHR
jgi:hypothetical protein